MLFFIRIAVLVVFISSGYFLGLKYNAFIEGTALGVVCGILALLMEKAFKAVSLGKILGGLAGLLMGIIFANLLLLPLRRVAPDISVVSFVLNGLLGYGGMLLGVKRGEKLTLSGLFRSFRGQGSDEHLKILDTSVIIDGRIADVCEAGFLDGVFLVPQFILQELQHIADSPDSLKRARGRRGLDILHRIQKMAHITVRITDEDFPKIKEVDSKLVALARVHDAKVITNDFNLNKVAELQGVSVLNINELANALKPVVLPGEALKVFVIKEGKEYNQGVAYLDDGTMVVVENGRRLIGKNAEVSVTSVLQTTAGRMIFSKPREEYEKEEFRAIKQT
ncbi:MAG TPA: PIN domain-containing protein [Thermodesulfovibrionales bacterium]|nr:PIN domain-containing protein [Thermodesulfovibrionales bacterium]